MATSEEALKRSPLAKETQTSSTRKGLGRLAVEARLITDEQLEKTVREQRRTGKPLPNLLQELCGLSPETVRHLMVEDAGIERVDVDHVKVDSEALKKVPSQFAFQHKLLPISLSENRLTVAMANPFELAILDQLQFMTRLYIDARYAPESKVMEAMLTVMVA